jgi:predicted O-methyltransferase YrrM
MMAAREPARSTRAETGAGPYGVPYLPGRTELPGLVRFPAVDLNSAASFPRVAGALDAPAQLSFFERLFLYGLVMALQPMRTLEIGFRYGGSAYLLLCALEDVGRGGRLVSIDPDPELAVDLSGFGDRFRLQRGRSPEHLAAAVHELGGPVQFCFIDGDHREAAVRADLEGVLPYMATNSYIVLHDACDRGVRRAIAHWLCERPEVVDCGTISRPAEPQDWGGMRLLRVPDAPVRTRPLRGAR